MEITFLGTGSAYPSPTRGASSITLRNEDFTWMFDCGEGTQVQVMKCNNVKAGKISKIFITHLHGDHMFGLPGLLCTITQNNQRTEPIELYGPEGLRKFVRTSLELSQSFLGFTYIVHEMKVLPNHYPDDWEKFEVDNSSSKRRHPNEQIGRLIEADYNGVYSLYEDSKVTVKAVWLKHRIPSYAFVVEGSPMPGKLDVEKLKSFGVQPSHVCKQLKEGIAITSPTGQLVHPSDVLGPKRPGRKIIVCGDTCDSSELMKVGINADVLVHEATLQNDLLESALEKGHSTTEMAAKIAKDLNVKKLILTHFSQRYKPLSADIKKGDDTVEQLLSEAVEVLGEGRVIAAEDFMTVTLPVNEKDIKYCVQKVGNSN